MSVPLSVRKQKLTSPLTTSRKWTTGQRLAPMLKGVFKVAVCLVLLTGTLVWNGFIVVEVERIGPHESQSQHMSNDETCESNDEQSERPVAKGWVANLIRSRPMLAKSRTKDILKERFLSEVFSNQLKNCGSTSRWAFVISTCSQVTISEDWFACTVKETGVVLKQSIRHCFLNDKVRSV